VKRIKQKLSDLINWQKIKLANKNGNRKNLLRTWIESGKKMPPPHVVKQEIIRYFQKLYSIRILIETGTFRGEMVYAQRKNFEKIISIELSEELFKIAKNRFKNYKHIEIIHRDSGKILEELINKISEPAIFWLDGHYSGFETAKGDLETPINRELKTVLNSEINHIILVDDARMFIGKNDYPTIQEVKEFALSRKNNYLFNVEDDIIRIYPPLE